jgi:uncharacterized membrane protein YphA (DoxX/SURF4 family)
VSTVTVTRPAWPDLIGTAARLGLAAVWLISGGIKAADPDQTWVAVDAYDVMPEPAVTVVAAVLPWFELALGLLLLLGVGTRLVAGISAMVLLAFMAGVTQAWARGLSIDCGCFGGGGEVAPEATSYGTELLRDTGFLALAAWLMIRPRTWFSLDGVLAPDGQRSPGGGGS